MYISLTDAIKKLSLIATLVVAMTSLTACNDDNEPENKTTQTFEGQVSSTIPSMPSFEAVVVPNKAEIHWVDAKKTRATVKLGAFDINITTPMGDRSYNIGAMTITDVTCVKVGKTITLSNPAFECQAGQYHTTGSMTATLVNGKLTMTIEYRPGSMPMDVRSVFEGR